MRKLKLGFTLVELLAVVAILSLLVIITLPNIVSLFNEAKKNAYETEIKNVYKSAQQQWMSDSMFQTNEIVYSKCNGCSGKSLKLSGRDEFDYFIRINKSGNVTEYCSTDNTHQYYYSGNNLDISNLGTIEDVASTIDDMLIEITPYGCERKGVSTDLSICYYSFYGDELLEHTKVCNSKKTVKQCMGSSNYIYLFKTDISHPNQDNAMQCYIRNGHFTYNSMCSNNTNYYSIIDVDTRVLPSEYGCYAASTVITCLDGETEVEVYDKKKKKKLKKKLKDITYDDLILCWDFDKGEFAYEKPLWIMKPQKSNSITTLTFDDGTILTIVGDHRIFDVDRCEFVSGKDAPIGLHTYNNNCEVIKLVNKVQSQEETYAYNVIVKNHINMFANGILTSQGSNNIYEFKDMKFVKVNKDTFTDEELNDIDEEYIKGLRLKEWNTLDKETREETLKDMHEYIARLLNIKK